jgi:hypothetical protein
VFEIEVADDVLAAQSNGVSERPGLLSGWLGPVRFGVAPLASSGGRDLQSAATAAQAAAGRFWFVTAHGVELPGDWAAFDDDVPSEVFGPLLFQDGVLVGASAEDEITPAQGATMLRIVLGELHNRKVSARVSCPPASLNHWNLPAWPEADGSRVDRSSAARDDSAKRWFVFRTVRSVTTTGLRYHDLEWLQPDWSWSRDPAAAMSVENKPGSRAEAAELVTRLREQATAIGRDDPRLGEVNSVLMFPEDRLTFHSLPSDSIRDHGHTWREPTAER